MIKIAIVGNGSVREAVEVLASNIQGSTVTVFKDVESGELLSKMPTNKMFEITNISRDEEVKSGREKRRERRKQQRDK
jgi:hypothetical protein